MWARAAGRFTLVALLIGAAAELQWLRERRYPLAPPSEDAPYLLSGLTTRRLAVGYAALAKALYWVLPNLGSFDVRAQVVRGQPVAAGYVALMTGYSVLYIAALIVAATLVFSRRDFK